LYASRDTHKGRGEAVLISIEDYVHRRYIREKLAEAEAAAGKPDAVILRLLKMLLTL
jgi:hypothetical protein